ARRFLRRALGEKHVQLRPADRGFAVSPARPFGRQAMSGRAALALAGLGALLLLLPAFAGNYLLSVATLFLYFAFAGQAWNIMMGFAGQLSLGHALYLDAAAGLYFHFGIGPWAGLWLAAALCALLGAALGALAFRYGVAGVYFTLLT